MSMRVELLAEFVTLLRIDAAPLRQGGDCLQMEAYDGSEALLQLSHA